MKSKDKETKRKAPTRGAQRKSFKYADGVKKSCCFEDCDYITTSATKFVEHCKQKHTKKEEISINSGAMIVEINHFGLHVWALMYRIVDQIFVDKV